MSHWEHSLMPLPVGQAIAFFYHDPISDRHEILSSYYKVPFLGDAEIEKVVEKLLWDFQARGRYNVSTYDPPGAYLSQLVRYLGYDMEPRDLQWELGASVIAATDFESKVIAYDVSLDKDDDSEALITTSGGHEIAHIALQHDRLIEKAKKFVSLAESKNIQKPAPPQKLGSYIVCRRMAGAKPRLEFMCDEFMGSLLMPREMVAEFAKDHQDWCFKETAGGWKMLATLMGRNFKVSLLTAAVRLTRLGYIPDISEAGCRVRSIEGWKEIRSRTA